MEKLYEDILAGIAMQEAGISHILNAEGEKIQLAVAKGADICQLLEINDSVTSTIEELMWLEFISYHKMKAIMRGRETNFCKHSETLKGELEKEATQKPNGNDCIPIKETDTTKTTVCICGRVFKENGDPATCGVVTANGNGVVSTEICTDGQFILKDLHPTTKLVVNAHSDCGKTGSFLLKKPFKEKYYIDMFLDG